MAQHTIFQGDNSPIRRVRFESVVVGQSSCFQTVKDNLTGPALVARYVTGTVTADSSVWFQVFLTPPETAGLAVGIYQWIVELQASGSSPPLRQELHDTLEIKTQGVQV